MSIITLSSFKTNVSEAVDEIYGALKDGFTPTFILYFASSIFEPSLLANGMSSRFSGIPLAGCTTAGEIISGQVLKESLVVMCFDKDCLEDVMFEVMEDISTTNPVPRMVNGLKELGCDIESLNFKEYLGLILIDGLSCAEEKIMDQLGNRTNITIVGGSAGDDLNFKKTHIYAGEHAYSDAAVLVLMKPKRGFDVLKTQSFCSLKKRLVATQVDEAKRTVHEFNNKPAMEAYGDALGLPIEEAKKHFMTYPLGLIHDGDPFVRSPQQAKDQSMVFYCNIKEGMELEVLKSQDIIHDTQALIDYVKEQHGEVQGLVNFHCILRTLELEQKGQTEAYGEIFKDIPTIGFSTYGEEYVGHINQTSMLVVFK